MRQLYFVVQTMLMDPINADSTRALFKHIFNAYGDCSATMRSSAA